MSVVVLKHGRQLFNSPSIDKHGLSFLPFSLVDMWLFSPIEDGQRHPRQPLKETRKNTTEFAASNFFARTLGCHGESVPWATELEKVLVGPGTYSPGWARQCSHTHQCAGLEGKGTISEMSHPAPAVTVPRCLDGLQLRLAMWIRDKPSLQCSALLYAEVITEMIGFYATKIWRRFYFFFNAGLDDSNTEDFFFFFAFFTWITHSTHSKWL